MNKRIKITIGIGLAVLLLTAIFATAAFAQGPVGGFGRGMMGGQGGFGSMMGGQGGFGGMMGGFGSMMQGWLGQATGGITGTVPFGMGSMMGGFGGMMGGGNPISGTLPTACPMAGGVANPANAQPISFDKAVEAFRQYLNNYNNADLTLAEVMEFENNFYAVVKEKSTGTGAFELLANRYTGYVTPEPGPNMMWNTKYGHMAGFGGMGMMGGRWNPPAGPLTVSVEQARAAAQQWLDANLPGAQLADDQMQFYGYYTLDFLKDGKTAGMLSVNGYTGQVWYHTWHGAFISEKEF